MAVDGDADSVARDDQSIRWVRKRDGRVAGFDPSKIASSLLSACRHLHRPNATFEAHELSQAVLHFLSDEFAGEIPSTAELADSTAKLLSEMGQRELASAYLRFRDQRSQKRDGIRIVTKSIPASQVHETSLPVPIPHAKGWDRAKLVQRLEAELELDGPLAREISGDVERALLATGIATVSDGLVFELVHSFLSERGLGRQVRRRQTLGMTASDFRELIGRLRRPSLISKHVGRDLFRQFALTELFSPDVASLHEEGLLHLFGLESPLCWSAATLILPTLQSRNDRIDLFLQQFERTLESRLEKVDGTIAVESFDALLAMSASPRESAVEIVEGVVDVLKRSLKTSESLLVLNVDARVRPSLLRELGGGPLFASMPDELMDRLAASIALRLAEQVQHDRELSAKVRIDLHPDPNLDDDDARQMFRHWGRRLRRFDSLRICFDRAAIELAEGLWTGHDSSHSRGVIQFIGINLPALWERLGGSADEETLIERLGTLCDSAVRAGVQKREFVRQFAPETLDIVDSREATLAVVPIGLDLLTTKVLGKSIAESEASLAFAGQLMLALSSRLKRSSRHFHLPCRLDGIGHVPSSLEGKSGAGAVGVTPAMEGPGPKQQIAAAGALAAYSLASSCMVRLADAEPPDSDRWADWVLFAKEHSALTRIGFHLATPAMQSSLAENWFVPPHEEND